MGLKRIRKINSLIKKEISQLLLKEIEFPKDVLVTVTRVQTSPDLKESRVFISVMSTSRCNTESANEGTKILALLNRQIYILQQKINRRLRMKPIPKILFWEEKMTAEAGKIEEIMEKLKKREN